MDNFQGCTSKGVGVYRSGAQFGVTQSVETKEQGEHAIPARVCWSMLLVGPGISCHVTTKTKTTVYCCVIVQSLILNNNPFTSFASLPRLVCADMLLLLNSY